MKIIRYFFEFLFIIILFTIFRILGLKLASNFGSYIGKILGPFFRSKKIISSNIKNAFQKIDEKISGNYKLPSIGLLAKKANVINKNTDSFFGSIKDSKMILIFENGDP